MNNTIFVVRHGQTDWNAKDIFQGSSDIPLNDTGRQQVREASKKLCDIKFDIVYCSPLSRARETCEIILNSNKYGGAPIFDDRIRERNFGSIEGTLVEDYKKLHHEGWWNLGNDYAAEGMETVSEVFGRVHSFLDEIKRKHKNKKILIVCHGGVMRAVYFYFNANPADGDLYKAYNAENAAVNKYNL